MAKLTIKNESGTKLEIQTPGGLLKLGPGESADVTEKHLKAQALADALYAGKASIGPTANPSKEQVDLAKAVLPPLVIGAGAKLIQAKGRFDQSQKELLKLREAFNKTWKGAESNLTSAQEATTGWPSLRKAVKGLILDSDVEPDVVKEKKDALKALEAELNALKNEDLAVTHRTLEEWYLDRAAKEQQVKAAREALAKVSKEKANPLFAKIETVEANIATAQAIAKNKAIGKEIPEFGQ